MFVTCSVLKLAKLSDVKEEQALNIELMSVTCFVLKLEKSSDFKDEQS